MPKQEEWRPVPSAPGYEASSRGRIRSRMSGHWIVLAGSLSGSGYRYVTIRQDGRRKYRSVHTMVCEAFHGPRPEGLQVRHLDGSRTRNVPSNLCWGTASENSYDAVRHGTHPMIARRAFRAAGIEVAA